MARRPSPLFPEALPARQSWGRRGSDRDIDSVEPAASGAPISAGPGEATRPWWQLVIPAGIMIAILLGRLVYLQVVHGRTYRLHAEQNRVRIVTTPAPRGAIIDRQGRSLAENIPNFILRIIPSDLTTVSMDRRAILDRLAEAIQKSVTEIEDQLVVDAQSGQQSSVLAEFLSYDRALQLIVAFASEPSISITAEPTREYPDGPAVAAFVGYTGRVTAEDIERDPTMLRDGRLGRTGLEKQYQSVLAGQNGVREIERDAQNRAHQVLHERQPVPGQTLQLFLDLELQRRAAAQLSTMAKRHRSSGAAVVVMDPNSGGILAMASYPSYDNNWFVSTGHDTEIQQALTSPTKPLLNRAISGQYPSGSIIKPLLATAGLEEKLITPRTTVQSTGGITIGTETFPDWQSGGHGVTDLNKAIAESVNTYFYVLGGGDQGRAGLGVDRMVHHLQAFGWGQSLGVDLPGESSGLLPTKEWRSTQRLTPWRLGDTYHLAIGQGDLQVTPLQVAVATSAIANGGRLYQPMLVRQITSADRKDATLIKTKVLNSRVASGTSLIAIRRAMHQGVLDGSSRSLQSLPVSAGAKTGTAQYGRDGKTHAWFTAFAPYDHPQIVVSVIVEGGGEGHEAALPVAQELLEWYFTPHT